MLWVAAHFPVNTHTRLRSKSDILHHVHKVNLWAHLKLLEEVAHHVNSEVSLQEWCPCVCALLDGI